MRHPFYFGVRGTLGWREAVLKDGALDPRFLVTLALKGLVKKRVTLTFPRHSVRMPVTYRLAKDFNVATNIIRAQVAPDQVGKLVVELLGDIDELGAAIEWMQSQGINVSLASREILIDENVCVHCGLCTLPSAGVWQKPT